jgi:diguanylate cyclase
MPDGNAVKFTVSLGVSSTSSGPLDIEELIHQADKALYLAKSAGRNRVCA